MSENNPTSEIHQLLALPLRRLLILAVAPCLRTDQVPSAVDIAMRLVPNAYLCRHSFLAFPFVRRSTLNSNKRPMPSLANPGGRATKEIVTSLHLLFPEGEQEIQGTERRKNTKPANPLPPPTASPPLISCILSSQQATNATVVVIPHLVNTTSPLYLGLVGQQKPLMSLSTRL